MPANKKPTANTRNSSSLTATENTNTNNSNDFKSSDTINKSRYIEYDNRPIKPLDQNMLHEKLSQFTEMSLEELETLRQSVNSGVDRCIQVGVDSVDSSVDRCIQLENWLANTVPKLKRERGYTSNSAGKLIRSIEQLRSQITQSKTPNHDG
jgi:hypothetical protein